jgi:hypothetical protein
MQRPFFQTVLIKILKQQTEDKKFSLHETIRLEVLKRDKRVVVVALFLTNDQQLT